MAEFNAKQQLPGLLDWMRAQMKACGGKTAVIGISGGKDSSVTAALSVAAYGRENGVERLFHRLRGADGRAVDLIAGEYDEIGVGSVQLRIEQTERRLLRPGGVLRVGNDKDTEFPIFVKLQHGILLRGGDRRGKSRQQQRRERRAKERSDFIHDEPSG